jgi:hypothetical protein
MALKARFIGPTRTCALSAMRAAKGKAKLWRTLFHLRAFYCSLAFESMLDLADIKYFIKNMSLKMGTEAHA